MIGYEKDVTKDASQIIKRIIHYYYEEQDVDKLENLDNMGEFLEKHNIPKLI